MIMKAVMMMIINYVMMMMIIIESMTVSTVNHTKIMFLSVLAHIPEVSSP